MVGRFAGSQLLKIFSPGKMLAVHAIIASLLVLGSIFSGGFISLYLILAVGLFNSIMFATIFTLAIKDVGAYTDKASGILCTAIVGGAIIPLLQGAFADAVSLKVAFMIPILCYFYIAYYGWKGHTLRK